MEARRATVLLLLLLLAFAALQWSPCSAARAPDSLLRLFHTHTSDTSSSGSDTCGPQLDIETPTCAVVEKRSTYELRTYTDNEIWVETLLPNSSYELSTFAGFYRCFNFISGKNSKNLKIEMTGPVHIKPAPESNGWKIAFFVPKRFKTVNDLPTPTDSTVHFYEPEGAIKAVIGPFGGFPNDKDYAGKFAELKEALKKDGLKYDESSVVYAGYSSPFQFRKRQQEVHVTIVPV